MSSNLAPPPASTPETTSPDKGPEGLFARTFGLAKSWAGIWTAYLGAFVAAIYAFQKLPAPFNAYPVWTRAAIVLALPALALVFHAVPELIERKRTESLKKIDGQVVPGYFQLAPREEDESYTRADGAHERILRWIEKRSSPILYLTGSSGTGKSSLLAAYVLPRLKKDHVVIRLRGYQDPVAALEDHLARPGVIWQKPPETEGALPLLNGACRYIRPRRLVIVLDQFEEFVILQDPEKQKRFEELIANLGSASAADVTWLLVFRNDYVGLIEKLALPPLNQNTNWQEVPPFTERAARAFFEGSGLRVDSEILRSVLREAAEIEQTRGLIRPITINLCGLVLSRFATGLPRGLRPGGLIRGFLRESISLPEIRELAPNLLPHMITGHVTKRPRSVSELAKETSTDPALVRGCLRVLGRPDRAVVRPLDAGQQTWEISHDFLVPLLDSIIAWWKAPLWRSLRPWLPWVTAVLMAAAATVATNWRGDQISELIDLGWRPQTRGKLLTLGFSGIPKGRSVSALKEIRQPFGIILDGVDSINSIPWADLKSLSALDLSDTNVSDVSALKDLKCLSTLDLSKTRVSDVSALKALKCLSDLNLSGTKVTDLSPMKDLRSLSRLNLSDTKVSDVSTLEDLKSMSDLDLSFTKVTDVSALRDLKSLSSLNLTSTNVTDVSALKDLKSLSVLDLGDTMVSDVSALKDLKSLSSLNLSGTGSGGILLFARTKAIDVSALKDLKSLSVLDLGNTMVSDVSALKDLKSLSELDLGDTMVSDVSALKDLKSLSVLNLSFTKVSDVSALKDLKSLSVRNLSFTKVSDVSALKDLKSLSDLDLSFTKVSDVSALKDIKGLAIDR
jgi:hypothetical protein